ncbi:Uncharacterised protein [Chromobacterium violaceum]|uniref:Uncharacterized protein n=1 Tax=Chromobacterium violaceum TaxID=536 RepID=A0A3S4HHM7_CHRVL|nr:Uncharacterised protein [Chromobacterium violaceum]
MIKTSSLIFSRRRRPHASVAASVRLIAGLCLLAGCHAAAAPVRADGETRLALRGTVVGPIASGSKAEGTLFRAYYLQLRRPLRLDDSAACGAQTMRKLALNQEGMERYKGGPSRWKAGCSARRTVPALITWPISWWTRQPGAEPA